MAGVGFVLSLCLQFLTFFTDISAFNLDTKVPIVKKGIADTYFGFSVAQHIRTHPVTGNLEYL